MKHISRLAALIFGAMANMATAQTADLEDTQTAVSGTDQADNLDIAAPENVTASISTAEGGKLTATATGVDAKDGDDTVSGDIALTTNAVAAANLLNATKKTEAIATSVGVNAGGGADTVNGALAFTSTASASGVYAGGITYTPPATTPKPTKIEISITSTADASGMVTGAGADSATNDALFAVTSLATSGGTANQLSAEVRDATSFTTTSTAKASAKAVNTGGDADSVTNNGLITNSAIATSAALSVGLVAPEDTSKPAGQEKTQLKSDSTAKSEANSVGISTEEDETEDSTEDASPWNVDGLRVTYHKTVTAVSANDTVDNGVALINTALATSGAGSATISNKVDGTVDATAGSEAKAEGVGITTGGGNDSVTNRGALTSNATANAGALSFAIEVGAPDQSQPTPPATPTPSADKESKSSTKTNVTANARATGIDVEGSGELETTDGLAEIANGTLTISRQISKNAMTGDDTVTNEGLILATAAANAGSETAGITQASGGSTNSESKSTATTYAAGVTSGAGADTITNSGVLTVSATSDASALSLGLSVGKPQETTPPAGTTPPAAAPSKLATSSDTSVTAESESMGIDAEGKRTQTASNHTLNISLSGLSYSYDDSTGSAAGNDQVLNNAILTSTATSTASAADAAITLNAAGSVNSGATTTATATSNGIYTGGGNDAIENNFLLTSRANASADSISLALTVTKPPEQSADTPKTPGEASDKSNVKADARATATATANGIDAEGAEHDKTRSIDLTLTGSTQQLTLSRSDTTQAGNDTVINRGVLDVGASAVSGTISAGIAINAAGSVDVDSTSKANATSAAILTGGGADTVTNTLLVQAQATASATALAAAVTVSQPTDGAGAKPATVAAQGDKSATASSTANAEASALATGIDTAGGAATQTETLTIGNGGNGRIASATSSRSTADGDDAVTNAGAVIVSAGATTLAGAVSVSIESEGTTDSTANAKAKAVSGGVLTGAGADTVTNSGALTATSTSDSGALAVSFTQSGAAGTKAKSDANATSDSRATGIGTGQDESTRERELNLDIINTGIALTYTDDTTSVDGADIVNNSGILTATSTATSGAIGAAIAIDGSASTDVTATANSRSDGIDTGGGGDNINNTGLLGASASSTSVALAVAFGQKGNEKTSSTDSVEAKSVAGADAIGIRADSGADTLIDASLAITGSGLEGHISYEHNATTGNDTVVNFGGIGVAATATSGAAGGAVAIDGVAKAEVQSTAKSRAAGIDGGGGDDAVRNDGIVLVDSTANSGALAIGVGAKSSSDSSARTSVEASSTAEAVSSGITTDGGSRNETLDVDLTINASGLDFAVASSSAATTGNDTLDNRNSVTARSNASSGTAAVAVTIKGAAKASANTSASADTIALDTGGGADSVTNIGALEATAGATAATLNAAISTEGRAISNSGLMGAGTTAKARAIGISTAGLEATKTIEATEEIDFDGIGVRARFEFVTDGITADGADIVNNSGAIVATSTAEAPRLNVGVTGKGVAVSMGRASTETYVAGIDSGNLNDAINNSGAITATTTSTAILANVAVSGKGLAVAANAVWDGGTEAKAVASGINADGGEQVTHTVTAEADETLAHVRYNKDTVAASGDDTIHNSGAVAASATALAPSLNVAVVAGNGVAAAVSTATANADATALRGGNGNDLLDNSGHLTSTTNATAATANISFTNQGVAIAADAVWDGGTKATATSIGIAGDGGDRTHSEFIAVGTDQTTRTIGGVLADGTDTITNSGDVDANATSYAISLGVAVSVTGVGVATATSTSTATASAIDAGAGTSIDNVGNSGHLTATAYAYAIAASVSVTNSGLAVSGDSVWDGGTKGNARARGIDVGAGGEVITNTGAIDATADALTASAAVAVAVSGVAGAVATATGTADATAIDASAGDDVDTVINSGILTVDAQSDALTAAVAFTNAGLAIAADAVWDGGTHSNARARGIDVGNRADVVNNTGDMIVGGDAAARSLAVSIAVSGVAGAIATSTGTSNVAAIDAGDDAVHDVVTNSGNLTANSHAEGTTAAISFTMAGVAVAADAPWDGGTTANSDSRGIRVGLGADDIANTGNVTANSDAFTFSGTASVAVSGVAAAIAKSTAISNAAALDAGDGVDNDTVTNSGTLVADSAANAASVAVSFTAAGVAVAGGSAWDGGTRATSTATGVALGAGVDSVANTGAIESHSDAISTGVSISIAVEGVAGAITAATSDSTATGIDGAAGNDGVMNGASILTDAFSDANTVSAAGTKFGVSVAGNNAWDGGATSIARSTAISGGAGLDTLANSGNLTSNSHAVSPSVSLSFTVAGVAAAISTATSTAESRAIDGGDDADDIDNTGALLVDANSEAVAVSVALAGGGVVVAADSVWDGGTTANASALGIAGGAGNDDINNSTAGGTIGATATANTHSISVSVTGGGYAASTSTSTANADAAAIDGGSGNDIIFNNSAVQGSATGDATSASISVVGAGAAVASDAFWDGGTKANATAAGLAGGDGNDTLTNNGAANAIANSETLSAAIAAALSPNFGLTFAAAASTSTANATALRADAGDDTINNAGTLLARSDAIADGVSVSFTPAGVAVAGAFDATTRANSSATGIGGADGVDTLTNNVGGAITLDAYSQTRNLAVSLTLAGVALAEATTVSDSHGYGLDGGAGNDTLGNAGTIGGTIDAHASSLGITAVAMGAGGVTANSTANSDGAGLAGGLGNDGVTNTGGIDLDFNTNATGMSISAAQAGFIVSNANAASTIDAAGLRGDAGADALTNSGNIDINSSAHTTARSLGVSMFGANFASANSIATSASTGMSGGSEDDTLVNAATGVVNARAAANVVSNAFTVSIAGATDSEARTSANVAAAGLDGGDGNDTIGNDGSVVVRALATGNASGASISIFGASGARAGTESDAAAVGINGGMGNDSILNTGTIDVGPDTDDAWMSDLTAAALSATFAGGTNAQSSVGANTISAGIDAGAGNDTLRSEGAISVKARARTRATSGSIAVFGDSSGGGESGAFTRATGIAGGDGDDQIESLASLTVLSNSFMSRADTSYTFGGGSSTTGTLAAITHAEGITGGAGVDRIGNSGALIINAHSEMLATGESRTEFGDASAFITSGAVTRATGLSGGDADDVLTNRAGGSIDIIATTKVDVFASAYEFAGGGPSTGAALTGEITVAGIAGDAGNDTLVNLGDVSVLADATLKSGGGSSSTLTATGGTESTGISEVAAKASGFDGGAGNDGIGSYDSLEVIAKGTAEAINDASTGTFSFVNDNEAGAVARSNVTAIGIEAGAGANLVELDGEVTVSAQSTAYSLALSSGATITLASDGYSLARSTANATATGVSGLDQDDTVTNDGMFSVTAHATTAKTLTVTIEVTHDIRSTDENDVLAPPAQVTTAALPPIPGPEELGTVIFWTMADADHQDPDNEADVDGGHYRKETVTVDPDGPGGNPPTEEIQWVFVPRLIVTEFVEVEKDSFPSYAASNGSGLNGEGTSRAYGTTVANASGVTLAAGNNSFENHGTLTVLAETDAAMGATADGDGFGDSNGYSEANATANAIAAQFGDGNDLFTNTGTIDVTARPVAQARAQASADDICIWFFGWWCGSLGHGTANAAANITGNAAGIRAGNGNNRIVNDGAITVRSRPEVRIVGTEEFVATVTEGDSRGTSSTVDSRAIGIETGSGNDEIVNNGSLRVEAWDLASACNGTSCAGLPPNTQILEARGIITGAGNDIVENNGSLVVETIANNVRTSRVGIDTGAGNDELRLGDGSHITGSVTLGDGDDTLQLSGTPTITNTAGTLLNVDAGAGTDTLRLQGAGSYAGTPLSIERAAKFGVGTYTLPTLASVEQLMIDEGTLRLSSGYTFAATATYGTHFYTDGRSGLLSVAGDAALDGAIDVERRGTDFISDAARFPVVHADGAVSGAFASIELPAATPLLRFEIEVTPTSADVVAHAASFGTVTQNPLYRQIGANLNSIAPNSSGDLRETLGRLQTMTGGFDRAFASLSPDTHLATSGSTLTNLREMTRVLQGHLSDTRTRSRYAPDASPPEIAFNMSGGSGGLSGLQLGMVSQFYAAPEMPGTAMPPAPRAHRTPRWQGWVMGIGGESENEPIEGYSGFDTDTRGHMVGTDRRIGNWLVGLNYGQAKTDIETEGLSSGEVDSWVGSVYGTWFDDFLHFETGLSYGKQEFSDVRTLDIGSNVRLASSEHDGDALSVFAAGGMSFGTARWTVEPRFSLNYFDTHEDAFEESGADNLNQLIAGRDVSGLFGEAGANFAMRQQLRRAILDWHGNLGFSFAFSGDEEPIEYSYAGAPNNVFAVDGRPVSDTGLLYGLGVSLIGNGAAVSIDWRGLSSSDREEQFLSARVSVRF